MTFECHGVLPLVRKINFNNARWEKYSEEFDNLFSEVPFASKIELDYNYFKDYVNLVAEKTILCVKVVMTPSPNLCLNRIKIVIP